MKRTFQPYPNDMLPNGFQYPQGYLNHAKLTDYPNCFLWWFIDQDEKGKRSWNLRNYRKSEGWKYLDDIDPIPFARNGDWAAYFDGNDHTGDPKIVVVDLGNKQNSYRLANFDAWLSHALKQSGLE